MCQSTNPQPELEATAHDWIDDYDTEHLEESSGLHLVRDTLDRIVHYKNTRIGYKTCDDCGQQHAHGIPWPLGYDFTVTRVPHCATGRARNYQLELSPPPGYKDHGLAGHAAPGTDYPAPTLPAGVVPDVEAFHANNPTRTGDCPDGCITVHDPTDRRNFHTGKTYTTIAHTEIGTPKFMFRTQQFYNADPRERYHWASLEVFDLELETWANLDMSFKEIRSLIAVLQAQLTGAPYLDPTTADNHSLPPADGQHTEGD
jgi:hypothetical protein